MYERAGSAKFKLSPIFKRSLSARQLPRRVFMVVCLLAPLALLAPPAGGQSNGDTFDCGEMTDSIVRLYQATFLRDPTPQEFAFSSDQYRQGVADLPTLANELLSSEEFALRFGETDNDRFVDLVYRNISRSEPHPDDRQRWSQSLDSGYDRGSLLVAFSESEEFVERTQTVPPLSGYLRWYPPGTHWYCGTGTIDQMPVLPLVGDSLHADILFQNDGASQDTPAMYTFAGDAPNATMIEAAVPSGFTLYRWNGSFSGDGSYGEFLQILADASTHWIVVFYPAPIGESRLGWQITRR